MSHGGPSVMETYPTPALSSHNPDYPGESVSGDTTVQGRDYRAQSVDYFKNQDSGGGTVISYATSTGYRSEVQDCGIDFDDKTAYECLDQVQERRRVLAMASGKCPSSGELRGQPGVLDMPDYVTKKGWLSLKKCLCFFIFLSLVALFVALAGAAIAIYAFLSVYDGGRIIGGTTIPSLSNDAISLLQEDLAESKRVIEELRSNLSVHADNLEELSIRVESILTPGGSDNATSPPPTVTTSTVSSSVSFDGCETELRTQCVVDHNDLPTGDPGYIACNTAEVPVERSGHALLNIYCNVNNLAEQNPIASNLGIINGRAVCTCFVIVSREAGVQHSFTCELFATYCPL